MNDKCSYTEALNQAAEDAAVRGDSRQCTGLSRRWCSSWLPPRVLSIAPPILLTCTSYLSKKRLKVSTGRAYGRHRKNVLEAALHPLGLRLRMSSQTSYLKPIDYAVTPYARRGRTQKTWWATVKRKAESLQRIEANSKEPHRWKVGVFAVYVTQEIKGL